MLRITVQCDQRAVTFQLEGRLTEKWIPVLNQCWRQTMVDQPLPIVRVDLRGVTYIDDEGKQWLAASWRLGAEFIADDCLTKAVVDEVVQCTWPNTPSQTGIRSLNGSG